MKGFLKSGDLEELLKIHGRKKVLNMYINHKIDLHY